MGNSMGRTKLPTWLATKCETVTSQAHEINKKRSIVTSLTKWVKNICKHRVLSKLKKAELYATLEQIFVHLGEIEQKIFRLEQSVRRYQTVRRAFCH